MINKFVLRNIYNNIEELSDLELQYSAWVKAEIPNYVSSYIELINGFDDCDYEGFITKDIKEFDLKEEFVNKLIELYTILRNYDGINKTHLEIINDTEWRAISEVAKEVKVLWENSVLYERMAKLDENNMLS